MGSASSHVALEQMTLSSNRHPALAICLRMIFSENQVSPIGSKPEGMLFGIMLQRFDSYPTMAQAESKKNARLPDKACGKNLRRGHDFRAGAYG